MTMKPRRRPRGESPRNTIAYQQKTIRDLLGRIEAGEDRMQEMRSHLKAEQSDHILTKNELASITIQKSNLERDYRDRIAKLQSDIETVQAKLAYTTAHAAGYRARVFDERADEARIAAIMDETDLNTDAV